jgi:DNA modification methylase
MIQTHITKDILYILGDTFEVMAKIESHTVDFIFADLPYGITSNGWDSILPFNKLWREYLRLGQDHTPYVFTGSGGFEFAIHASNPDMYKYKWIWNKNNSAGFALAKKRPFQITEDVLVFGTSRAAYYPIMEQRGKERNKGGYTESTNYSGLIPAKSAEKNNIYYPKNILNYSNASQRNKIHPNQKSLELMKYLVQTYTREGDLVMDNTMGSGVTGIACLLLNRRFIGIESNEQYYTKAVEWIRQCL